MKKMNDGFTLERPRVIHTKPIPQNEQHYLEDFINKTLLPYGSFSKIRFSLQHIGGGNLALTINGIPYQSQLFEVYFSTSGLGESEDETTFNYVGSLVIVTDSNSLLVDTTAVGGIPSLKATIYGIR